MMTQFKSSPMYRNDPTKFSAWKSSNISNLRHHEYQLGEKDTCRKQFNSEISALEQKSWSHPIEIPHLSPFYRGTLDDTLGLVVEVLDVYKWHLFHFPSSLQERNMSLLEYILRAPMLPCQPSDVKILSANMLGCISLQGGTTKGRGQVFSSLTAAVHIREQRTFPFGSELMSTHSADGNCLSVPARIQLFLFFLQTSILLLFSVFHPPLASFQHLTNKCVLCLFG